MPCMPTLLLIDDQPIVCHAVKGLLAGEPGMVVHCCSDPADAVATALRLHPSLILLDMVMPGISGLALLAEFRRAPALAATPVVMLSAHDDDAAREQARAAGARDYLVKLPTREALAACIRRYLEPERPGSGAGAAAAPGQPAPPAAATESERTLDRDVFDSLRAVDPDSDPPFFDVLIEQFLTDAAAQLGRIAAAVASGQQEDLRIASHSLGGAAATIGAARLAALCRQLERHGTRRASAAAVLASEITREFQNVSEAVAAERRRPA